MTKDAAHALSIGDRVATQVITLTRKALAGDATRGVLEAVPTIRDGVVWRAVERIGDGLVVKWSDDGSVQELGEHDIAKLWPR